MKTFTKVVFLAIFIGLLSSVNVLAQIDKTSLIVNPSFETGDYTGWTWVGRVAGWQDVNEDGDDTKDGLKIAGHWDINIQDVECYQEIEVPNGTYKVSALITVSVGRISNQRLFANNNSTLYGPKSHIAYSRGNLAVLTDLGETYTFAGLESFGSENGPFFPISVTTAVTDGKLRLGMKFSGAGSESGYNFAYEGVSDRGDVGFFKFDGFTLEEVQSTAIKTVKINTDEIVDVYSLTGTIVNSGIAKEKAVQTLAPGVYILKNQYKVEKIVISGK
jgi:hypothetical protein